MDTIKVYKDKSATEWRWGRYAANGRETADSGEGYATKAVAIAAAERESDGKLPIVLVTEPQPPKRKPTERLIFDPENAEAVDSSF